MPREHERPVKALSPAEVEAELRALLLSDAALGHAERIRQLAIAVGRDTTGSAFLHSDNDHIRDAAIYTIVQALYDNGTEPDNSMLTAERRLRDAGFDNVTMFNMGPLSNGRSISNHQAAVIVDDSLSHPEILIVFRGTKDDPAEWREDLPNRRGYFSDVLSHVRGAWDYVRGASIGSYRRSFERFADAAVDGNPDDPMDGIFDIVRAQIAQGKNPHIVVAGHSYGGDAAGRFAALLAREFPEYAVDIEVVTFGATQTLNARERREIYADLRIDPATLDGEESPEDRAYRYVGERDPIARNFTPRFSWGRMDALGEAREIRAGHLEYPAALIREAILDDVMARAETHPDWGRDFLEHARRDLPEAMEDRARDIIGNEITGFNQLTTPMQLPMQDAGENGNITADTNSGLHFTIEGLPLGEGLPPR